MGLAVSLEHWDAGSMPGQAHRVKDPALPQLRLWSQLRLGSDPRPGNSTGHTGWAKKTTKKSQLHIALLLLLGFLFRSTDELI